MADLQYPIGKFVEDPDVTTEKRQKWIGEIAAAPEALRAAVARLTTEQLETAYRPGGWTVRQVVHHMPDSHMHVYVRFRLALTESEPAIKGYDAAAWAERFDARTAPGSINAGCSCSGPCRRKTSHAPFGDRTPRWWYSTGPFRCTRGTVGIM